MIFVKDGSFAADFIMPPRYGIEIPVYNGEGSLADYEMSVLATRVWLVNQTLIGK